MTSDLREVLRFDHVGVSVGNLEQSHCFYADVLGFSEIEDTFELPAHGVRGMVLLNRSGTRIELFEHKDSRIFRGGDPIADIALRGWFQLALAVSDIHTVYAHAVATGARAVKAPFVAPDNRTVVAFVADMDNNLIELVQRAAAVHS